MILLIQFYCAFLHNLNIDCIYCCESLLGFLFCLLVCFPQCAGAKVILACRDMEKAQEAVKEIIEGSGNDNVSCMKLDLSDSKSIREFAEVINESKKEKQIKSIYVTF